jgi:hypothetical protein
VFNKHAKNQEEKNKHAKNQEKTPSLRPSDVELCLEKYKFRSKIENAPRPYRNATKLCTYILCVKMGVHAKIHREILSLSRVASVPVLENRSLGKFVKYSSGVGKFKFLVGDLLILCLTTVQKIKKKFQV